MTEATFPHMIAYCIKVSRFVQREGDKLDRGGFWQADRVRLLERDGPGDLLSKLVDACGELGKIRGVGEGRSPCDRRGQLRRLRTGGGSRLPRGEDGGEGEPRRF